MQAHEPTPPLDALPTEVVEEIALHACARPFLGPPTALPVLLGLSRRIHAALCVQNNPGFHARVFRAKFDTLAPHRRFLAAGQPLTAVNYAAELRRRWIALRRIRHTASAGRLTVCSEEDERADFWLLYLMFIESDGKNYAQMNHWAQVTSYVRLFIRDQLMPSPRPGFQLESTMRSLGLWLMWFLTQVHAVVAEVPPDTNHMHAMLRPWVFASHKYDTLYAPYTHFHLPAPAAPAFAVTPIEADPLLLTPQYLADLHLRNRTEIVTHMSRRIPLAPPPASTAAIMIFMVRLERNGPLPPGPPNVLQEGGQVPTHPGLTSYPRTRFPSWEGAGSLEFDGLPNHMGSADWDSEWLRIMSCGDPYAQPVPSLREQPKFRPGDLMGEWEGRFVFLGFDAFRDMLAGSLGAAQSGTLAQQPQVWRIHEHHCIDRRRRVQTFSSTNFIHNEPLPVGRALDAYIPANSEFLQHGEFGAGRRLEVRVPNANDPGSFKSYVYETRERPDLPMGERPWNPPPAHYMPDFGSSDASESRYSPPAPASDDEWVETITDTIITGEGHSSWGQFQLRGRIRHWDGMITIVKDYAGPNTEGRGRWLYKGYIIAGANWVGRWRDTFTAEHLSGYEGVFSVSRRQ